MSQGMAMRRFSDIEIARGVVAALSYSGAGAAREFHVNAFRSLFGQFADLAGYRFGLAAMKLMGEVEPLTSGYWLAAPVRLVDLGSWDLVVAPTPTSRLTLELPGVKAIGIGRAMKRDQNILLPRQSLSSWLRCAASRPMDLVASIEAKHSTKGVRAAQSDKFEYFFVRTTTVRGWQQRSFGWRSDIRKAASFGSGIRLGRERISTNAYRFFLLSQDGRRGDVESSLDEPPTRLQYAIACLSESPINYTVRPSGSGTVSVELVTPLPKPEYQIARCISSRDIKVSGARELFLENEHLPVLESRLQALGCERISSNEK